MRTADSATPPPSKVGYKSPVARIEYGLFEDRRSRGLGFALIETHTDRAHIYKLAQRSNGTCFVRVRTVTYRPWEQDSNEASA